MLPFWFQIHKGREFYFPNPKDLNRMIENIKRNIDPYQELTSLRLVNEFLNSTVKDLSGRKLVRVKALIMLTDLEDFEEVYNDFIEASKVMSWREDVVFGVVRDKKIIKEVYENYGSEFFPEKYDLNTVAVHRIRNRFDDKNETFLYSLDSEGGKMQKVGHWIAEKSIGVMEEMNELNQNAFPNNFPLMVAFIDPQREAESWNFLREYRKMAEIYYKKISFVWVDFKDNMRLKTRLGVKDCIIPCVGVESEVNNPQQYVLEAREHNIKNIKIFLNKLLNRELEDKKPEIEGKNEKAEEKRKELTENIRNLSYMEFVYDVLQNNNNALVFIHDPYSDIQIEIYKIFAKLSEILYKKFNLLTVRIYSYDVSDVRVHSYFYNKGDFEVNTFYLFRGDRRDNLVFKEKVIDGSKLMKFLLMGIEGKFRIEREKVEFGAEENQLGFYLERIFDGIEIGENEEDL